MRCLLLRRSSPLAPFGRTPDACGFGAGTFASYREMALRSVGVKITEEWEEARSREEVAGPALLLSDDLWVTQRALRGFLRRARAHGRPCRLALPPSRLTELFSPLQDLDEDAAGRCAFPLGYVPEGARASFSLLSAEEDDWVEPPYKEVPMTLAVPRYILGREDGEFSFPLTSMVAMRIRHWVHVLRASHLAPQVLLIEAATRQPLRSLVRGVSALRWGRAATLRALKARFVFRGRGGFVHPTATVESSVLGDDVHVGAYAYVVNAVLGDGVTVEERAHVVQSALGPRTFVSRNSTVSVCGAFGDADVCTNGIQGCVIDERCALTSFARPLDMVPGEEVRVLDGERLRGVGELPCGAAFGPGVFVGADVSIAAGRAIPAGLRLVAPPGQILRRVDGAVEDGGLMYVEEGRLRRI